MDPKILEVTGLEDLEQWLDRAPAVTLRELKKAMERAVLLVKADLAQYPPATASNRPGRWSGRTRKPMGWYERGRGWWYPVLTTKTLPAQLGKAHGAILPPKKIAERAGVAGYKLAGAHEIVSKSGKVSIGGTSEVLGKSWATEVRTDETGVVGVLGNDTSYIDYVQGEQQTLQHRGTGWRTIQQVLDADEERVINEFEAAIDRIVASFNGSENGQG